MSSGSETVQCPNCGNQYKSVAGHWAKSSTCDYPELDPAHREALAGLLLTGGDLRVDESAGTADYTRSSTNEELLRWLADFFGVLSSGVTLARDGEDTEEVSGMKWTADADGAFADMYRLRTRRLPELRADYYFWHEPDDTRGHLSVSDAGKRVPRGLSSTPLMLKIVYAFKGGLIYRDDQSKPTKAQIQATAIPATDSELRGLFGRFSPRISTNHRDHRSIILQDTRAFFEFIESDPYTPEPLPGCADRWPATSERDALATIEESGETCASCGVAYQNISNHWQSSDTCSFPVVEDELQDLITGVLIVGASIPETPNQTYYLETNTTDRSIAEYLQQELAELAGRVEERDPQEESGTMSNWVAAQSSEEYVDRFDTIYRLKSHGHPVFDEFREWYEMSDSGPATKHIPEDNISASPALLRGMYVYRGLLGEVGRNRRTPSIFVSDVNATTGFFERLFEDFGGELHEYEDGRRRLLVRDTDSFFQYIGDSPVGLEHKWPDGYGGSVALDDVSGPSDYVGDPLADVQSTEDSE